MSTTKRIINIGILASLLFIFIQLIGAYIELIQFGDEITNLIMNSLNMVCNITMFTILWIVIIKYYKQLQLDILMKSMISILIMIASLSIVIEFQVAKIILLALSLINLILYFVFFKKIIEIDKNEIKQIEYLKNYALTFIICVFIQFGLSFLIEINNVDLKFVNHLLVIIPTVFIIMFFNKIKNEKFNNVSA